MNHQFTAEIQAWLATPDEEKDYEKGALYFLQLSNNKIMYRTISSNPKKYAKHIIYQIQKYVNFRVQQLTHDQVEDMQRQVALIVAEHALDKEPSPIEPTSVNEGTVEGEQGTEDSTENISAPSSSEFRKGMRADHALLPPDIQAKFQENFSLLQEMRELHLKLRMLSTEDSTCPDSERYPFLKELIEKDKRLHKNWEEYDHYVLVDDNGTEHTNIATDNDDTLREQSQNATKWVNLAKGRYKKNPSDELKAQIIEKYLLIESPSEKLTEELKTLGILE